MTVDADLRRKEKIPLVPPAMALNTDTPDITMRQQKTIGRAVRVVTDAASLELDRRVFEDPGSSLLGMTLEADIRIEFVPAPQSGTGSRPVGGMAVRTKHGALQDFMPCRKIELSLDFQMTGKAKIAFLALEEF